jgi:hypothetical protein
VKENRLRKHETAKSPSTTQNNGAGETPAVLKNATYNDANGKLYFRTFMWTGTYGSTLEMTWIYMGNNGSIVRNPKNGVNPVNFAAELANNSDNVGKYAISNGKKK